MKVNHSSFENKYFPSTIIQWDKLDPNICNSISCSTFKKRILEFSKPFPNSIFSVCSSVSLIFLTGLQIGLSLPQEPTFCHNFLDSLNAICDCGKDIEPTKNFLLHYQNFTHKR